MIAAFSKYWPFTANGLQVLLTYRLSFFMMIVASAMTLALQLYLWHAIYGGQGDVALGSFYLAEITTYLLVGNLLHIVLDNRVEHEVAAEVMHGDIAINFIRPLNYLALKFFTSLAVTIANLLFVAVPLLALFTLSMNSGMVWPERIDFILFILSAGLSFGTSFLVNVLIGCAAFWTTNIWGVQVLKTGVANFFSGYLIPLSFLGGVVAHVANVLPFRSFIYSPLQIFLGKYHNLAELAGIFGLQLFWLGALLLLCTAVLRRATYRLEVLGG